MLLFRYHLKDVIVGKIYFLLVRIKIKHMEIAIIKRETTGTGWEWSLFRYETFSLVLFLKVSFIKFDNFWNFPGPNSYNESETIAKYEIMDGAPVRGVYFILVDSSFRLTYDLNTKIGITTWIFDVECKFWFWNV